MKKRTKEIKKRSIFLIPIRYLALLILMFSTPIIYSIFFPLTLYPVVFLLKIFTNVSLEANNMLILGNNTFIQIVPACIAASAYLLLLMLNLAVPMKGKIRIYSILLSFSILLILNILRIIVLSLLYQNNFIFFDFTHKLFWYGLSTIFVVAIWFSIVKIFKIKGIPIYSDLKFIYTQIKKKK